MTDHAKLKALLTGKTAVGLNRREFMTAAAALGASTAMATTLWSGHVKAMPTRGGHLRIGADGGGTSDTFDPMQALGADHPTQGVLACYDTLTEIDATGTPVPSLAESWDVSSDGTRWAFKLRRGVEFHDGQTLTAKDVVWSLNQHLSEDNKFAEGQQIIANLEELKADDDRTVVMVQKEVNFDLPAHLSAFGLIIGKEGTEDWNVGVGTGPYRLEEFEPGVRFRGTRFENFYREDQGYFDSVEILNIADAAAKATALLGDSVDVIGQPDVNTARRLDGVSGFSLLEVPGTQHYTADMRTDMDPFTDNNVRLAIKYGIRREEILDKVFGGFGYVGNDNPIGRGVRYFNTDLPQREFDPDRAKFHLKEAGLDSLAVEFSTSDGAFAGAVDMGVLMQESLKEAGVDMTVKREPADGYWSNVWLTAPWCAVYWNGRPTVDWMLTSTYISTSPWNSTYFQDERFDRILAEARAEGDEAKRQEMYFELQEILHNEGGAIVLAFASFLHGVSDRLGHGPVGVSRRMDDSRLARRWWFNA
ncbi:MAG: ABC transporter substrate-binding protein [Pseudomonadota bacterium]